MTRALIIGGPAHGKWYDFREPLDAVIRCDHRSTGKHLFFTTWSKPLRPCLELQEIEALTGSTCHREPPDCKIPGEIYQQQEMSLKRYWLCRWVWKGREVKAYCLEGMSAAERERRIREALAKDLPPD